MDNIKQYLLTVIGAAIVCSIIINLVNINTLPGALIRVLSGIFIVICALTPIVEFDIQSLDEYWNELSIDSVEVFQAGEITADSSFRQSIKQQTESYILDKAAAMNTELTVEVTLSNDDLPVPCGVSLTGRVSPYVKHRLSELLESDLGISKENQVWNQ